MCLLEREVEARISEAVAEEKCDAVLAVGYDNFTYLTGTVLPFAPNYPDRKAVVLKRREGQECIICPIDWEQAILDQGWKGSTLTCSEGSGLDFENIIRPLTTVLGQYNLLKGRIGLDFASVSTMFMESLKKSFQGLHWFPFDARLQELRLIKSKGEIKLLETSSRHSEIGIIGALQHMEGSMESTGYTLSEFSERVRVHVYEAGGSGVGHMGTMCGVHAQNWYSHQQGKFREGELVRIEVTNHFHGYWANACRMAVIGQPDEKQEAAYRDNVRLKKAAEDLLRPGVRCSQVFQKVAQRAKTEHLEFCSQFGMGHGVGVSEREEPYLHLNDETVLQPGMVVVLSLFSYGPQRELICSKDTYEIGTDGCRLLSWYKNWDRLYPITGFRSAH